MIKCNFLVQIKKKSKLDFYNFERKRKLINSIRENLDFIHF